MRFRAFWPLWAAAVVRLFAFCCPIFVLFLAFTSFAWEISCFFHAFVAVYEMSWWDVMLFGCRMFFFSFWWVWCDVRTGGERWMLKDAGDWVYPIWFDRFWVLNLLFLIQWGSVGGFGLRGDVCHLKTVLPSLGCYSIFIRFFRLLFLRVNCDCNRPSFLATVFAWASAFNRDLNRWNVAKVTVMSHSKSIRIMENTLTWRDVNSCYCVWRVQSGDGVGGDDVL